jgi:preprotein translocase subunit SecD
MSMLYFSRLYQGFIVAVCALGILACVPNFLTKDQFQALPKWAQVKIGLGLDLRGGAHMLMAMDTDQLRKDWLDNLRDDARKNLRDAKIGAQGVSVTAKGIDIRLVNATDTDKAMIELKKLVQTIAGTGFNTAVDLTLSKGTEPGQITLEPTEQGMNNRVGNAAGASIETIRRRIDPAGVLEPNIVRQGRDRILIQVPGVEDTRELKRILGETAKLTFHDVHPTVTADEARRTRVPAGFRIYKSDGREGGPAEYVLRETPVVGGEDLADAHSAFDQRNNEPIISFRFNQKGAKAFGAFTGQNVGRPFAIVLDNKVLSAPVIREAILGGSGQISGQFTLESANTLAIQLRSGALPAKLTVVEERVVGANLGADSIEAGKWAAIVGMIGVAAFMIFAYGLFGVFATICAALQIVFIVALMTIMGSTLTLPGIAGIVLTLGMAVDSNVLIYERIREELRNKTTPLKAIEAGFDRAYLTIVDSQLTSFIAGVIMFVLGSGPIRGFAVTLTLGVITTMFTAFTVTRLLVSWWVKAQNTRKLEAPLSYKMART